MFTIRREALDSLFEALKKRGYTLVGPTIRENIIAYGNLEKSTDLPIGWTDEQEKGTYRLKKRKDAACFGYVVGPHSWKRFVFPPKLKLWEATTDGQDLKIQEQENDIPRYAFIGVRPCEIAAIQIQDRVFLKGEFVDPYYQASRKENFILAVNCNSPGKTCFCASMNTGPKARANFDLSMTEIITRKDHYFLVEAGSKLGKAVLKEVPCKKATRDDVQAADALMKKSVQKMGRELKTEGLKELLYQNMDHARWDDVADRCLSCANCTMVCPTCFCSTVEDTTDLTGKTAQRERRWDSCFTIDFSYIYGGSVRNSVKSRYRQWMTHKLASWVDQFGSSGCVGCGRCITWCPVGIDITEEVQAIRKNKGKTRKRKKLEKV